MLGSSSTAGGDVGAAVDSAVDYAVSLCSSSDVDDSDSDFGDSVVGSVGCDSECGSAGYTHWRLLCSHSVDYGSAGCCSAQSLVRVCSN